ncbi:MAG: hypothetical protein ACKVS9_18820 [Phycisphaerae bacterium]
MASRYHGMWRDLWWVILASIILGLLIAYFVAVVLGLIMMAIGVLTPLYFASLRYDKDGNQKQM